MSILNNHHYNQYTHFLVELENWGNRNGRPFSRRRVYCRKHLKRIENALKGINHLTSRVISIFPEPPVCVICKADHERR